MKRPTLADVARRAAVSPKTVSNVLLNRPHVSEATRARVRAAAEELGYRVNKAGRGLANGTSSGRIRIVVPNLYQPYFAEMAERLILGLEARGLSTTLRLAADAAAERAATLDAEDADGVIVCPHTFSGADAAARPHIPPIVQVGGAVSLGHGVDAVVMGEYEGMLAIGRHLLETGRRRFAVVWNSAALEGSQRFEGITQALREAGLSAKGLPIAAGSDWDRRDSGYEAMVSLLHSGAKFDAVICVNDALAVGALRALRVAGHKVPHDVAVTGFDDTEEARFTSPPLTSIDPDLEAMAATAVEMLCERLAGFHGPERIRRTGANLVARQSTGSAS